MIRTFLRPAASGTDRPIREELYSIERLEQYAAALAAEHRTAEKPQRVSLLLPRLEENGRKIVAAYKALAEAIRYEHVISPAAEWLVDNFHIVEDQLREIRQDLPKSYYYELPKLAEGEFKNYPRIYALSVALIAHSDSQLDTETLRRFVNAYQKNSPLSIGELWAVPIMLRFALVENLRRLATGIVSSRAEREEADRLADQLLDIAQRQPNALLPLLSLHTAKRKRLGRTFVVQLTQRLREQDPALMLVFEWLEKQLAKQGNSIEKIVHEEHQAQASAQVTVGNIITSMRLVSTLDWKDFFETVSLIDPELAKDPAGVYSQMDFATRDRYRHVIERISKRTKTSEPDIARAALHMAEEALNSDEDRSHSHVGYFLVGDGVSRLEAEVSYRPRLNERMLRMIEHHASIIYLGNFALLSVLIVGFIFAAVLYAQAGITMALVAVLLSLIPASDLALSLLNWDLMHIFEPRLLPKIDLSKGIPPAARTMVVVPVILADQATVAGLVDRLEIAYLANQDEHLHFALLGDFADAFSEEMPADREILVAAEQGIEQLNKRYGAGKPIRFHLFHRRRQWCKTEQKWIGWERKRGKLREFNRLLRGERLHSFIAATAGADLLSQVRYVITLDADTQLPRDAAQRLIGAAIHPLNQPRFDPEGEQVVSGYGILQPRVSISLESASRSMFARIFSGNTGIDPYTTAASDIFQDLFGEGIYTGKGLYDVDAFEKALADRVPDQTLLSHDLFESIFARAALVSDIEFLDDYPAHYDSYAKRQHRWTRGDWQIARWLWPTVRDANGDKRPNQVSAISRWKILDNLRRSLLAPAITLLLIAGWTLLPGGALWWTLFAVLTLVFPIYAHVTTGLLIHPRGVPWTSHFWSVWGDMRTNTAQLVLETVFLPHQAYLMLDAITRATYRMLISHRHLLEWVTAARMEESSKHDRRDFWQLMWPTEAIVSVALIVVIMTNARDLPFVLPIVIAWALSPLIAFSVSRHLVKEMPALAAKDISAGRIVARRTWRFFETFVGDEDHWLPPDSFQEDPRPVVAHRTSPTNIGLLLLSTLAAYDFGYLGLIELLERIEFTLKSLEKLPRFRGHFFNWYDTRTLTPLGPQYVSVVDSGNLAGALITLNQACVELRDLPLFERRVFSGLSDTMTEIKQELSRLPATHQRTDAITMTEVYNEIESCVRLLSSEPPPVLSDWAKLFDAFSEHATAIDDFVTSLSDAHGERDFTELRWWTRSLLHEVRNHRRDLNILAPWVTAMTTSPGSFVERMGDTACKYWEKIAKDLPGEASLAHVSEICDSALPQLDALRVQIEQNRTETQHARDAALSELTRLGSEIEQAGQAADSFLSRLEKNVQTCQSILNAMDFLFLLDPERKVFTIGYNLTEGRHDDSFYDLLASEARLASFIAIAKGDVPQEHWFRMGRQLTSINGGRALISWTGSIFEYLMPALLMRDYRETLLGQTYRTVVSRHIEYAYERGVPWGISESASAARDLELKYHYAPFGVPGLGLKRGLIDDLVVSPYSTILASNISPTKAMENLRVLEREGALSRYGFYDALDYTPERVQKGDRCTIVRAYMAHHLGMSLIALDNLLNQHVMQDRFHGNSMVQAAELLLQERIPRGVPAAHPRAEEVRTGRVVRTLTGLVSRAYDTADLPTPQTQLLSNGTYSLMITTAGAGYSMCGPLAVTRWREDCTRDNWGSFIYIRDVGSGAVWSAGHQPVTYTPQSYEVAFSEDKADFWRRDNGIVTHMDVIVSAEDNVEVRRVSITNYSVRVREIEITSYAEVVLAPRDEDLAHPAFSNIFIETEFHAPHRALFAYRRPRSSEEKPVWGVHVLATASDNLGGTQFETDRARFLGRGHNTADPVAVMQDRRLSNTVGSVLDPIFSLRCRVRLTPNETAQVVFTTGVADSRELAIALAEKYSDPNTFERESRLAWTRAQVQMSHLHIAPDQAHLFQQLAGRILYADPSLRPRPHVLALNQRRQSDLWSYGITGELPILVVRIGSGQDLLILREIIHAHEYLYFKGLKIDLVILNDEASNRASPALQDEVRTMLQISGLQGLQDKPGGVFLRRTDLIPEEDRILLHDVARAVIVTERGPLEDQILRRPIEGPLPAAFTPRLTERTYQEPGVSERELSFFNGLGGFDSTAREYVIVLNEGQWTPAPWANIIANNKEFGFQITESGGGCTWSLNSHDNRLTSWSNDAVSDPPGEVIYLRDEETGVIWSPTPLPIREAQSYTVRHGQGYTVFEHTSHGVQQELLLFVPLDAPAKISLLRLRNRSDRHRTLSVTFFAELVLGQHRSSSAPYIVTDIDEEARAIFARNSYNNEFAERVTFVSTSEARFTMTCDRKEFIGRNGSLAQPAALRRVQLAGRDGAGLDPCAAIQISIELQPGEAREVVLLLGEGESIEAARKTSSRFASIHAVNEAFELVLNSWEKILGKVEVRTPDQAMNTMLNRWLLYQTLSCRILARAGFYESAGAYGFRDQLQDVMALIYSQPEVAREQILRAAARQFKEGDVLHSWHEPTFRGVRTRSSDDLLWLPYVASFYVNVTGDYSILERTVPFIEAPLLDEGQIENYVEPTVSMEASTVMEHCARAIDRSLSLGKHDLPLMGSGDWNDGLNRVGIGGEGESVWLGWFLCTVLSRFVPLCDYFQMESRANRYRRFIETLKTGLEQAWDGDWYRRAYFDDGTPLGSAENDECRIDSIAQTWAVMSGAGESYRAARAMAAVDEYLIRRGDGLVVLLAPSFDKSKLDPGYLKGYAPGVRENGGQCTQAAIWTVIAFAMLGDGDRAGELFALLNPINHASTRAGLSKYRVEPYVVASDVYAVPPHTGRGGWSWYTGSAAWMYRAGLESILGFKLCADRLTLDPCIPRSWREYEVIYEHGGTTYQIKILNPLAVCTGIGRVEIDGEPQRATYIQLVDDQRLHNIVVVLGKPSEGRLSPLFADLISNLLTIRSIHEIANTSSRINWMTEFDQSPTEIKALLQTFDRVAQYTEQHLMPGPSAVSGLSNAIRELEKAEQLMVSMADELARPVFHEAHKTWKKVLLIRRKTIQEDKAAQIPNPFIYGDPLKPGASESNVFAGRADIIKEIAANILETKQPPSLLLHGPRRAGKTSILYQLPKLLQPTFAHTVVDLQQGDNVESIDTLLFNISRGLAESLRRLYVDEIPEPKEDTEGKPFGAFQNWLRNAVTRAKRKNIGILVCFDEYEQFSKIFKLQRGEQFLENLRSIQHDPGVVVMLAGVKTLDEISAKWVRCFINAKHVRVSFLSESEVRPLLEKPIPEFKNSYEPGAIESIFKATNGQPFLTQAVAWELFHLLRMQKRRLATIEDVEQAIERAIISGAAYFANVWQDAGKRGQAILTAIAMENTPPDDFEKVDQLQRHDVINTELDFYVPMVKAWVKNKTSRKKRGTKKNND